MRSIDIRNILGISRAEFCRRYKIPPRTVQDWDLGKRQSPEWLMELLERVVIEDKLGINPIYKIGIKNESGEFTELVTTDSIIDARSKATELSLENNIEIRAYDLTSDKYIIIDF
ncbi:MAG: hypothetical protein IJ065_14975 [Eubacterium sp.]|nr:hypothetical protein [Eubacterium sp.]